MTEPWQRGAGELADLIATGELSSVEVVEAHLDRIEAVNGPLNAVVKVLTAEARAAAADIDRRLAAGETVGPLGGVPFTIKVNIDLAGHPSTNGSVALAEAVPAVDAPVVARMKAAGAVPLARTNMPDMGLRIHTDSALHGLTRNPWHPDRTAGGSSGGEGSALASGMSPIGLGNDLGGSLRNPASCCGIAALKPTVGVVPDVNTVPVEDQSLAFQVMAVQGAMARRVSDVGLGLSIVAGQDPRDPTSVSARLRTPPTDRPLRVAVMPQPPGGDTDERIADVVRSAAAALSDAGCEVVEAVPPRYEDVVELWSDILMGDVAQVLPLMRPLLGDDAVAFIDNSLHDQPERDVAAYAGAYLTRDGLGRAWGAFFTEHDLVLGPTWTELPFEHGADVRTVDAATATMTQARSIMPANALGLPSACVPAGLVDGLPVGVLLDGDRFSDLLCLEAAAIIEAALGLDTPIDPVI